MAKKKSGAELKEEGASLGEQITLARKRAVNFALQIGKDGLVLETDVKKNCEVLWRNAKKNGGGPKGAMGTMNVRGKVIELNCVDDSAPNQLPKLAKKWLSERGQAYKVVMITPAGTVGDEDDEEEEAVNEEGGREQAEQEEALAEVMEEEEELLQQVEETGGGIIPGSELMEGEEELQTRPSPEDGLTRPDDEGPGTGGPRETEENTAISERIQLGQEPKKRDLSGEFNDVRKDIVKAIGQLSGDAQTAIKDQIMQFGELMKSNDLNEAQRLMDDMATATETVSESQRGRARDDVAQIDTMVGDVEAELDALEAALKQQGAAA